MNVSDLLQDSPSQPRRRPPPLQHDSPPPTQSAAPSLPSASASPHQPHHAHHSSQPPQTPYPPQPQPGPYFPPHPYSRPDPPPMHRITPRPPSQIQSSSIDPTPAMASLQHPSPSAPPHPHTSWGPPTPRQGSSPLAVSNLGPPALHARTSHHHQPPAQIKPAMPGSDRSPVVQRSHASGSSTPSNIAAHSPTSKPLLTTAAGVLILDKRTADEQMARPPPQAHPPSSAHPNTSPGASLKSGRDREKEWDQRDRERQQEEMDIIRHTARERVVGGPFDRERDRERALPSPRERPLASPLERSLTSPHDRSVSSAHDRPLVPPHDRPIPSPHERDRPPHLMHRMSPLARAPPAQGPPPLRTPAQQSPPGSSHRMAVGPPLHDRMPPPNERERMPPLSHDRPPHDRDRIHPPPPHSHPHRQGSSILPGQGHFQTYPPEWDAARERDRDMAVARERERDLRERDMQLNVGGPPRDLVREEQRDPEYGFHPDHDRAAYIRDRERQRLREGPRDQGMLLPQRERDVGPPSQRDIAIQRDREPSAPDRDREFMPREMEGMSMLQRERDMRERELHIQRERERVASLHREEIGPGMPPRGHDRERERDRERRTYSRMPSPHHSMGSTSGPGAPGPHHSLPPHEHPRERELQLINERDRQLAWERDREREREMDRRQYRERMPMPDRERMGMPVPERDNERMALADRERAMAERDRAMFERDRMAISERDRAALIERDRLERERMAERDRVYMERDRMIVNDRDRVMHDRERALPPERVALERERVILDRPGDRDRMRTHLFEVGERERAEAFERERERERIEMMERERGLQAATAGGGTPSRDREADKDRKTLDVPMAERERDERPPVGPGADRELIEKRERERIELLERERSGAMDREREQASNREGEPVEAERERLEARERFEMLQREISELYERDRLGGLDIMERERLARLERESFEMFERERLEILERERLDMLERMPSAEELAKARKEREKKPFVSLGMYVWPRTPFPYYFPEWIPTPIVEEEKPVEAKPTEGGSYSGSLAPTSTPQPIPTTAQIPTELRLTVIVPPSFLPPARPQKFRLWGGGLPPPPPFPYTPSIYSFCRRRVYTDDSDVIQCAVHAGLLTWNGIARAKKEGRTIRVALALVPTLASASGAVRNGQSDSRVSLNGLSANGHVNGTASVPRTRTNTPLPMPPAASSVPSTSSSNGDPQPPGYAGGVWASRFIGGWGESFYGEESAGRGDSQMSSFEEAEDDGRGCVSCGWGWGHDGSAFEVISVDVVEQNAHVAPGLGIRNRAQRLAEYAQRRADVLGLPPPPSPPLFDVTNTPKRRRLNVDFTEMKKAGLSEMAAIAEEAKKMQAMTISFGIPDRRKSRTGIGFKYDAQVVQCALFPHLHQESIVAPPPAKRRKISAAQETQVDGDVEMESTDEYRRSVVLESSTETYLVTRSAHDGKERYTLSVLGPPLDASQPPCASTSPADASVSKMQDSPTSPVPESSEGSKTSPDDPPADRQDLGAPPETTSKGKERETGLSKSPSTGPLRARNPKPSVRVVRSDLFEDDFAFENGVVVVKGDEGKMVVDGDGEGPSADGSALRMTVLRWRWYSES